MEKGAQLLDESTGLNRCKKCRHGYMLYNSKDTHVGRALEHYGEWSEEEMSLLGSVISPGSVVLDVGANIGCHTVFFAKAVGPTGSVYAFEPERVLFQQLCANIALNSYTNVATFHSAVGESTGMSTIPRLDHSAEQNFGGVSVGEDGDGVGVSVLRLDDLGLPGCHVIKIDVEGMELEVINGAAGLITSSKPVLYVENNRADRSAALIARLQEFGYHLYWHFSSFFTPDNYFGNPENVLGQWANCNMLAVPLEIEGLLPVSGLDDTAEKALERFAAEPLSGD